MNRVARTLSTILATIGLALLVPVSTVVAADACSLTVSPRTGVPGTEFVFKGKGFTPTTLSLSRGDADPVVVDVSDATDDRLRFALVAQDVDVGRWRAKAAGCADTASIRVTLPPTSTAPTTIATAPDQTTQLAGMTLLGVLFLGTTALLLPRVTRAARSR